MKVWIVEADDRYYDEGSCWVVGVYSTEEKANIAKQEQEELYAKTYPHNIEYLDVFVSEVEVDA